LNHRISKKDKKDWENFLSSNEKLYNKDNQSKNRKKYKIKNIDLHGFSLEEANETIEQLINDSYEKEISKIIVVTGKGIHSDVDKDPYVSKDFGILKYSVPEFIKNNSELMKKIIEIKNAEINDGGDGAFYIFLKKKKLQNKFR
tara:strand:+ start:498 stop:929 length:432 start_codon:yes stop_codon:yes gene_type:complete